MTINDVLETNGLKSIGPPTEAGSEIGQIHFDSISGNSYEWDGKSWHSDMKSGIALSEVLVFGNSSAIDQNYDFSGVATGLFGADLINTGFNHQVDGFLKANPFKAVPAEIKYVQRGSNFLGGTIATLNVGLAYNSYRNDDIGLGKFGYKSAAAGGSWYIGSLYGGPAGIAAGGAFGLGELMYDANVVSVKLRKEVSMQENHPHRIENTNIFSKGFWSEISRQMTPGNWINGFSY